MSHNGRRIQDSPNACFRALFFIIFLLFVVGFSFVEKSGADCGARISSTFIQPLSSHASYTDEKWNQLFNELANMGINRLIVQWSVYDNTAFYKTEKNNSASGGILETILQKASERGVKVYIGLYNSSDYWTKIRGDDRAVDSYMKRLYAKTARIAAELFYLSRGYPSFAGWYIPQEIDDVNWLKPSKKDILTDFLKSVTLKLKELSPDKPIAISGFSNAYLDPESFKDFWTSLIASSRLDLIFFQDGIGAGKQTFITAPLYFDKIKQAASEQSVKLSIVVEIFRIVSENPFKAVPAPIEEIIEQMRLASSYSTETITAFSIPEYMTSLSGSDALDLQRKYLEKCSPAQ